MIDDILNKEEKEFMELILSLERESISNIVKTDDKQMVNKIIRLYEEKHGK